MANRWHTIPGYVFPNIPEKWGDESRRFVAGLRMLFDDLFTRDRARKTRMEEIEEQGAAASDYLSMMTEVAIPTDTANKKEKLARYYRDEVWNKQMIQNAVGKWITESEYTEITGEVINIVPD